MIHPTARVHPLALVEGATVGARTRVWQFASVIRGAVLGEDCTVASNTTLDGPWFGDRCIISQGVAMGPGFLIGNEVFIGPNVTFCNDYWPAVDKEDFDISQLMQNPCIIVGDGASIGANAVILPGVEIGRDAMIAAGAVVKKSVPQDHIARRDGSVVPIIPAWRRNRMKLC